MCVCGRVPAAEQARQVQQAGQGPTKLKLQPDLLGEPGGGLAQAAQQQEQGSQTEQGSQAGQEPQAEQEP